MEDETGLRSHGGYARKALVEYGRLVEEIGLRLEEMNLLKRGIGAAKEREYVEKLELFPDKDVLEEYGRTIKGLEEDYLTAEKTLSSCELRVAKLGPSFYCNAQSYDNNDAVGQSSSSKING